MIEIRGICLVASLGATVLFPSFGYSQEATIVRVGDFRLFRSVDFMTDEVSYGWARTGDSIPGSEDNMFAPIFSEEAYETLELGCSGDRLQVVLTFFPDRPRTMVLRPERDKEPAEVPERQPSPVQLRFDSDPPLDPVEWVVKMPGYEAEVPREQVGDFLDRARPATRLRVRIGPFKAKSMGIVLDSHRELEFSLLGFTKAVEFWGCGGTK